MTTNAYFADLYTASAMDQELFDDIIIESIQVHGRDMTYLPRTLTNFDSFFGEDSQSAFNSAIVLEFYLENVEGWQGDNKFLSKFGLEIRDEATLICARSRFKETVTQEFPDIKVPREGDIIMLPSVIDKRKRAFEISYVEGESVFYQLGELYVWKLKIRNFEYNGEAFNTGDEALDKYEAKNSIATVLNIVTTGNAKYTIGETVRDGSTWSATVINHSGTVVTLVGVKGDRNLVANIVGDISGTTGTCDDIISQTAQDTNDNEYVEDRKDDLVDFSEGNPFSGM